MPVCFDTCYTSGKQWSAKENIECREDTFGTRLYSSHRGWLYVRKYTVNGKLSLAQQKHQWLNNLWMADFLFFYWSDYCCKPIKNNITGRLSKYYWLLQSYCAGPPEPLKVRKKSYSSRRLYSIMGLRRKRFPFELCNICPSEKLFQRLSTWSSGVEMNQHESTLLTRLVEQSLVVDTGFGLRFGWSWQSALWVVPSCSHWSQLLDGFCDFPAWVVVPGSAEMAITNSNGFVLTRLQTIQPCNSRACVKCAQLKTHWSGMNLSREFKRDSSISQHVAGEEGKKSQIAWSRISYIMGHACQGSPHDGMFLSTASSHLVQAHFCCIPILLLDLSFCSLTSPWNSSRIRY